MSGSFSVYTESESDDIPAQPGLYAFFVDLVGPGNCGLRAGEHVTASNFTKIANNLDYRLRRLIPIFRQLELSGRVIQSNKFGPLQRVFDFTGRIAAACDTYSRLVRIPSEWLYWAAGLLGRKGAVKSLLGSLVVDTQKTRDLLGWMPYVSMDEQLKKMAKYDADT